MSTLKIFIVEDDKVTAKMLQHYLSLNPDNDVEVFYNGKDCIANLYKNPDVITLDYYLPGENGDKILQTIRNHKPDLPVVIVSAQKDVETAIKLFKKDIYDYVVKGENTKERLWNIVNKIRGHESLLNKVNILQNEIEKKYDFSNTIIGESEILLKVFPLIKKACNSGIVVSVMGETGTGKELVAKAIHYNSDRKNKSFVPVNVSAIPTDLIEAELFGHEKGAFTGAINKRIGKFEEANNGTIFLDEIADMDFQMQTKLLRVLQEQQVTRIGGNNTINLNVRVIVATNKNLEKEVADGRFREDLYYRLMGISIVLPPLRLRGNDIIILAKHFINNYCKDNNLKPKKISKEASELLFSHHFPGNIRELKAIVELAVVLSDNNLIEKDHIQIRDSNYIYQIVLNKEMTLEDYNKEIIKYYLNKYNNKVRLVADKLGIGKSTIYRLLSSGLKKA